MSFSIVEFENYGKSVKEALDILETAEVLSKQNQILIKPNLINCSPHPVTTPWRCCEAIIRYIQACSPAKIIIGEGCGDSNAETDEIFEVHGYTRLIEKYSVELVDLNHAPLVLKKMPDCTFFKEMYLPEIAYSSFLISVPVLKAHSLAGITGTMKNMMGLAPPKYYSGRYGTWKKAVFHKRMQQSVTDLNRYRSPDLTVMDATIGLPEFHLGGRHCNPPVNKILAGFESVELDRKAAELLHIDWQKIGHLRHRLNSLNLSDAS